MKIPMEHKLKYLERKIQEIESLIASLENNDYYPALKLGHQVKGNAATFGFPQMGPIGAEIEIAAKNKDSKGIRELIRRMYSELRFARESFQ